MSSVGSNRRVRHVPRPVCLAGSAKGPRPLDVGCLPRRSGGCSTASTSCCTRSLSAALLRDFSISTGVAGLLGSLTLVASESVAFSSALIADRFGRRRALIGSVLVYSIFTAACGLAQSIWQLGVFRFLLGLGMGGEWTSGAAMVSETWPDKHRGKAVALMQSALGHRLRRGRPRRRHGASPIRVAGRLPHWHSAGAPHALDSSRRRGVGNLAAVADARIRRREFRPVKSFAAALL